MVTLIYDYLGKACTTEHNDFWRSGLLTLKKPKNVGMALASRHGFTRKQVYTILDAR